MTVPWPPDGERGDGMGRVTLQTIADQLGVSRMTVSNAFSRPEQLSAELRERILQTAEELGYAGPDPAARALARGTTGAVGVLLTDSLHYAFTDEVATAFLGALVEGLGPTGLAVTLLTSDEHDDVIPARDVAIDGAVVYCCQPESVALEWLLKRKLPLMYVDHDPVPGITSVNVDDRGGARAAAQHLLDLGHRRVAIVVRALQTSAGVMDDPLAASYGYPQIQRTLGWLDALEAAGVEPLVVHADANTDDAAIAAARRVFAADPIPTGVLCFSDVLAVGCLAVARDLGLAVPDDVSVIGFDDSPAARRTEPQLTTVRQDVLAKGRQAALALTNAIEHARAGTKARIRHLTLPTELVVRGSSGPGPHPRRATT